MRPAIFAGLLTATMAGSVSAQTPLFPTRPTEYSSFAASDNPVSVGGRTIEEITAERILMAPKIWVSGEYQLLWAQNANTPQLIERIPSEFASSGNNSYPESARIAEFPRNRDIRFGAINSYRVSGGVRIMPEFAIDGSFFTTDRTDEGASVFGSGLPGTDGIARHYVQAGTGTEISLFSAQPGNYPGHVNVTTDMRAWGADSNLRWDTYSIFVDRTEFLLGVRYLNLRENFALEDVSNFSDGSSITIFDQFQTRNEFYGGQVGFHSRIYGTYWSFDWINKYAIGGVRQSVSTFGSNTYTSATGLNDSELGGLYARGANLGTFSRTKFAVAAELALLLGYNVTQNVRLHVGYNVTWISSVIRATEVIDPVVNDSNTRFISQSGTAQTDANRPAFQWNRASDYHLQGLTFGVTVGY
ncbi:MAG: BBP7 family outer membrane beta-barrel protein [Gemmataceae bacterium]